jgi:hypothetical protein
VKPNLFSTEQLRAILEGRKTITRWVAKNIPEGTHRVKQIGENLFVAYWGIHSNGMYLNGATEIKCPYQPGDILWVRETWAKISDWAEVDPNVGMNDGYIYKADWGCTEHPKWRLSTSMPREAARIFLRITDVRVERVQVITAQDAKREGMFAPYIASKTGYETEMRGEVRDYWDYLNTKRGYGWDHNPWVWVIEFERTEVEP